MEQWTEEEEDLSGENEKEPRRTICKGRGSTIVAVKCGTIKDVAAIRYRAERNGQPTPPTAREKRGGRLGQRALNGLFITDRPVKFWAYQVVSHRLLSGRCHISIDVNKSIDWKGSPK